MTTSGVLIAAFLTLLAYVVCTNLVRRAAMRSSSPAVHMLERLRADIADESPSFCLPTSHDAASEKTAAPLPTEAGPKPSHVHGR